MIHRKLSPSMQLSAVFLLFGTLWILLTDFLTLGIAGPDNAALAQLQTYKGILFMLLSALLIYFVSRRIFRKQVKLREELNEERLKYRNNLAQEVFNAQEAERKKLGEELHDNINQLLGVVKLYIEHAQVNPAAKDEMLKKCAEYLKEVINEIRALSRSLISPTLTDIGLIESINEMKESLQQTRAIHIEVDHQGFSEKSLSDAQKMMVYRITQEQLNNILKHSKAEHVDIALRQNGTKVQLMIQDDGVGFDVSRKTNGLGLKNIRHRLELFNGNMYVESAPSHGCKLEAEFEIDGKS